MAACEGPITQGRRARIEALLSRVEQRLPTPWADSPALARRLQELIDGLGRFNPRDGRHALHPYLDIQEVEAEANALISGWSRWTEASEVLHRGKFTTTLPHARSRQLTRTMNTWRAALHEGDLAQANALSEEVINIIGVHRPATPAPSARPA